MQVKMLQNSVFSGSFPPMAMAAIWDLNKASVLLITAISAKLRTLLTGLVIGGVLPTGQGCDDSWIVASTLAAETERLKFLVALRPGIITLVYAARQTVALDRLSDGRLLINIVVGGNPVELAAYGVFTPHDERYSQAAEFFHIWSRLLAGERVNYSGRYYRVDGAQLGLLPKQKSVPLFFGGSSDAGIELAARKVEKYLT